MKILATVLLILSLSTTAPMADPQPNVGLPEVMLGMLVIGIAVTAYICIVRCASSIPSDTMPVTIVLETSQDHSNWTPIATNTVVLQGRQMISCFTNNMDTDVAFFRARVLH